MKFPLGARIAFLLGAVLLPGMVNAQYIFTTNNGAITITGYSGAGGELKLPAAIGGLPVTAINDYAFYGTTTLLSVTIPDSVTSIREGAFLNCSRLAKLTLGSNVESIGINAFANTRLYKVKIPLSVTNIATGAFDACSSMTAFTVDTASRGYSSENGVLFDRRETVLLKYPEGRKGRYAIPAGVTNIAVNAFANARLNKLIIPDTITSLPDNVFFGCSQMKEVIISDSVASIGNDSFGECTSLHRVAIPGSVTNIGTGAFSTCTSLTSVTMAEGVTSINGYAFAVTHLTSVTIPASVTNVGTEAFGSNPSLAKIYFKGDAPVLGPYVFDGANKATLYYLPSTAGWDSFDSEGRPIMPWNP